MFSYRHCIDQSLFGKNVSLDTTQNSFVEIASKKTDISFNKPNFQHNKIDIKVVDDCTFYQKQSNMPQLPALTPKKKKLKINDSQKINTQNEPKRSPSPLKSNHYLISRENYSQIKTVDLYN